MSSYTPLPWTLESGPDGRHERCIWSDNGKVIALLIEGTDDDAALLVAAPDLLVAAQTALDRIGFDSETRRNLVAAIDKATAKVKIS